MSLFVHRQTRRQVIISLTTASLSVLLLTLTGYQKSDAQALSAMEAVVKNVPPQTMRPEWTGMAYHEQLICGQAMIASHWRCCWSTWCSLPSRKSSADDHNPSGRQERTPGNSLESVLVGCW